MFMFCVFAVTDLVIIGIFYAVYGTRRKYSEGMLLGVHLPQSAAERYMDRLGDELELLSAEAKLRGLKREDFLKLCENAFAEMGV